MNIKIRNFSVAILIAAIGIVWPAKANLIFSTEVMLVDGEWVTCAVVSGTGLTGDVVIPDTYTVYDSYENATWTYTVRRIGSFAGCSMTSVVIPNTITKIDDEAFKNCPNLESVVWPESVGRVGDGMFMGCTSLSSVTLPATLYGIGERAFMNCSSLETIELPNSVTQIGKQAFMGCSALLHITMPTSLRMLGSHREYGPYYGEVFKNCYSLQTVIFNAAIQNVNENAFENCTSLTNIVIPESAEVIIHENAFKGCTGLTELNVPVRVDLYPNAFDSCTSLATVHYNARNRGWEGAFNNCHGMTNLVFGDSVELIQPTFNGLQGIRSVAIPCGVKNIAQGAFADCHNLDTIYFNAEDCQSSQGLMSNTGRTLIWGSGVKTIPAAIYQGDTTLATVEFPDSVITIKGEAYGGCSKLKTIVIPNTVRYLDGFGGCLFDTVTIGSSVEDIAVSALPLSQNAVIYVLAQTPPTLHSSNGSIYWSFGSYGYNCGLYRTVHVPCGTKDTYYNAYFSNGYFDNAAWRNAGNLVDPAKKLVVEADTHGTVEVIVAPTCENDTATIAAVPDANYRFGRWSDGDTNLIRTIVLSQDTFLIAYFTEMQPDCDSMVLPYSADFTQCWTTENGATVISSDSVRLNGHGQKIVSPQIVVPDSARLYFCWMMGRDNPDGSTSYMELTNSVDFHCRIASVDRYGTISLNSTYINYYDELQSQYAGQTIQIEFEYTGSDTVPIYLTSVVLFQYDIRGTIEAPAFAYVGDTVDFIPQVSVPAGDTADAIWWYYHDDAGSWLYGGERDTLRLSWSIPGSYTVELGANKHNVYAGKEAAVWVYSSITILDNTTVNCDSIDSVLNVNNINTTVYPLGYLGYDGNQTNYFVNGTRLSTLYANGLWIGNDEHTAARQFGSNGDDFIPGPLTANGQPLGGEAYNRVWAVSRDMIDYHIAHYAEPGYEPAESIGSWPAEDANVGHALAPYHDVNNDGHYNPLDGDYPLIRGDRAVFSIFNDACTHGESGGQALGVEVHCMTYAFHEPQDAALWNTVFVHYDIYNRSTNTYDNTYIGMWSDFDIGYAYDDYVGCDVSLGMYYAYNGKDTDGPGAGSFYAVPPAQGCVILGGPWQQADGLDNASVASESWRFSPGDTLGNQAINGLGFGNGTIDDERMGMTNFTYYENAASTLNGAPTVAGDYYNYLRSTWKNGQHVKYGGNGLNWGTTDLDCSFMFPGDSDPWHWGTDGAVPETSSDNWSEASAGNSPGDRRGLGSCGPFTFRPSGTSCSGQGQWQQLDVAYVTGWSSESVWQSVENLRSNAASVRQQFANQTTASGRPFIYQPIVTGIGGVEGKPTVQVYPNPTKGFLTVSLSGRDAVELFDMMGRKILSQRINASATLNLQTLPQGVYILRTAGGVKRIVKQ